MATVSKAFNGATRASSQAECDQDLQAIISDVQHYLQSYNRKRFFLSVSVKYHKRCCKSWSKIGFQLQKFLKTPKEQYSVLMVMLEQEIKNFPKGSYYCKQLRKLIHLLEKGPLFSIAYLYKV
jgi:hypothetical protein